MPNSSSLKRRQHAAGQEWGIGRIEFRKTVKLEQRSAEHQQLGQPQQRPERFQRSKRLGNSKLERSERFEWWPRPEHQQPEHQQPEHQQQPGAFDTLIHKRRRRAL